MGRAAVARFRTKRHDLRKVTDAGFPTIRGLGWLRRMRLSLSYAGRQEAPGPTKCVE